MNSKFYHISATPLSSKVHPPALILPTSINIAFDGIPTDPVVVTVVFNKGHSMRGGKYEVIIDSGTLDRGIHDVAGNALDGDFYGRFPTGDGLPGGDFVATIETFHNEVLPAVPIKNGFVSPATRLGQGWRWREWWRTRCRGCWCRRSESGKGPQGGRGASRRGDFRARVGTQGAGTPDARPRQAGGDRSEAVARWYGAIRIPSNAAGDRKCTSDRSVEVN